MWFLLKKEWLEFIRDKRAIMAAFSMGIFGPVLMLVMFSTMIEQELEPKTPTLILSNIKENSYLTQFLTEQGIEFSHQEMDVDGFKQVKEDGLLVKEDGNLTLYTRVASKDSQKAQRKLEQVMAGFVKKVTTERLLADGVNILTTPFEVNFHEVKEKDVNGERILGGLLVFILTAPFFAALAVANDATAGERERGTLMGLMSQPISPWAVAISKWLIVAFVGMLGLAITLIASSYAFEFMPLYKVGISVAIGFDVWALMFVAMIPIAFLGAALQVVVAIAAKSFKEGTSLLTMVSIAPMILAFVPVVMDDLGELGKLPILAQQEVFEQLLLGMPTDWSGVIVSSFIALAIVIGSITVFRIKLTQPNILQGY